MLIALKSKQFEIYSLLRSLGFLSNEENFNDVIENLERNQKIQSRHANRKYFEASEYSHLVHLLSKSKLGFNTKNRNHCFEAIPGMYFELNEIPEISATLKALENSDQFEIVFDFNKSHVMDLDPTATESTNGLVYPRNGYVYVAAEDFEERSADILGVIGHELTHYVMQLIYNNNCKPYGPRDVENEEKFKEISDDMRKFCSENPNEIDPIIRPVFVCYPESRWHAELIVRVPQLLAKYKNDKPQLEIIKDLYCKKLFEFYDVTLNDIRSQGSSIKPKRQIKEINEIAGLLKDPRISYLNIDENKLKNYQNLIDGTKNSLRVISTNVPELTVAMMSQVLFETHGENFKFFYIFVALDTLLMNEEILVRVKEAFDSSKHPSLIVYCPRGFKLADNSWYDELKYLFWHDRTILIMTNEDFAKFQENLNTPTDLEAKMISHCWEDLEQKTQDELRGEEIVFQGHRTKLQDLISTESCASLTLKELITDQEIKIFDSSDNTEKSL